MLKSTSFVFSYFVLLSTIVFCGAAEENNLLKNGGFSKFSEKSIAGCGESTSPVL
jgi:hypothetical protein